MNLFFVFLLLFFAITILCVDGISTASTTTTPPTNVSSNAPTSSNTVPQYDYYVCGNETKLTDCTCINETLDCQPSEKYDSYSWYNSMNPPFTSMNIQIMNKTFIPRNVSFVHNHINKIKKGKVLPGHENTVETLRMNFDAVEQIENGTFDKFISLKILDLRYNYLRNITAGVLSKELGSTLTVLKLADNAFSSMELVDFSNMYKLEELDISFNGAIGNNDNFSNYIFPSALSNLRVLDLSYNFIRKFNDNIFTNLINLETLKLIHNSISSLPKSVNALTNLQYFNLQYTQISSLDYSKLQNLSKLETFEMTHSLLVKIDDCTFCDKPNLKSVMLYENGLLSYIHENAFGNVLNDTSPPLESFSVESCNLSIIPEDLLNWHTVKEFGLGRNPFICNCSMAWLINDIISPNHTLNMKSFLSYGQNDYAFKCYYPYVLRNTPFTHISQKMCPVEEKKEIVYERASMVPVVVVFIVAFILGMAFLPLGRRIWRPRAQQQQNDDGFVNQNFGNERNVEDFDEVKIYY